MGIWDFEPRGSQPTAHTRPTAALPGSQEKLDVLAERLRQGMPLWHPADRISYDDESEE
jgi:hypothetical protein